MQPDGHVVNWEEFKAALGCTIFWKDSLSGSSMNFWHLPKGTALYFNTHRLSITCVSTQAITPTRTPRKEIDFAMG
jgi:hypothetical protein